MWLKYVNSVQILVCIHMMSCVNNVYNILYGLFSVWYIKEEICLTGAYTYLQLCVCVCVCLCEWVREYVCVYVCKREREIVCVCVRERERERERSAVLLRALCSWSSHVKFIASVFGRESQFKVCPVFRWL